MKSKHVLYAKLILMNTTFMFMLIFAFMYGLMGKVFVGDFMLILPSLSIAMYGLYALVSFFLVLRHCVRHLEGKGVIEFLEGWKKRKEYLNLEDYYNLVFGSRIDRVSNHENRLVTFGLIGTVIGILIALYSLGTVSVQQLGNLDTVKQSIWDFMQGVFVAFNTTMVGGICAVIIEFNKSILVNFINRTIRTQIDRSVEYAT